MNKHSLYKVLFLIIVLFPSGFLLHYSKAQDGSNDAFDSKKSVSEIVVKPTPEMPLLSATLDYVEKHKKIIAAQPYRVISISEPTNIYSLFWIDGKSILIDSFQGDAYNTPHCPDHYFAKLS